MTDHPRTVVAYIAHHFTHRDPDSVPGLALVELAGERPTGRTLEIFFHHPDTFCLDAIPPMENKPEEPAQTPFDSMDSLRLSIRLMVHMSTLGLDEHMDTIASFLKGAILRTVFPKQILGALDAAFLRTQSHHQTASLVMGIENVEEIIRDLFYPPGFSSSSPDLEETARILGIPAPARCSTPKGSAEQVQRIFLKLSNLDFNVNEPLGPDSFPPLLNALTQGNAGLARRLYDHGACLSKKGLQGQQTFDIWDCLVVLPHSQAQQAKAGHPTPKENFLAQLVQKTLDDSSLSFLLDGEIPGAEHLAVSIDQNWGEVNAELAASLKEWAFRQARLMLDQRTPSGQTPTGKPLRL